MQSILLPQGYQVPFDISENAEINAYILETGYKIYQSNQKYYDAINKAKQSLNHSELKDEYDLSIKKEKAKHQEEIERLLEENLIVKNKYRNDVDNITKEYEINVEMLRNKFSARCINDDNEVDKKCRAIEEKYANEMKQLETKYQNKLNEISESRNDEIKRSADYQNKLHELHLSNVDREKEIRTSLEREYQETLRIERERYNTLSLQHTALTSTIAPKTITTIEIGNIGEEMIEKWTRELFHNADITDTSGQTSKGDFHIKIHNKLFLFEIKNKLNIQRSDIEKFIRDIEGNASDIHGGLFISLGSPSIPNKGDFSLEYISNIPVIYLHVPDRATLKVAIKTLMFLNNRTDNTLLTMTVNQIYTNLKAVSSAAISMNKNLDEARVNMDSLKREIRNGINVLDQLFNENPDMKFEITVNTTDYRPDEIKIIQETYISNKKAKMDDYAKALGVVPKYLQDRGGAAKIKTIVQSTNILPPRMVFNNIPVLNIDSL